MQHFYQESEYIELLEQLCQDFAAEYSINDMAHQLDHVRKVAVHAIHINETLKLGLDRRMLVIPAILHDMYTRQRDIHHLLARLFILTSKYPHLRPFSEGERLLMADAAAEHRASYTGEYSSMYSQVIAAADRGVPADLKEMVDRSWNYAVSRLGCDETKAAEHVLQHLKEKYATTGYARYPDLYLRMYGIQLAEMRREVAAFTLERVKELRHAS